MAAPKRQLCDISSSAWSAETPVDNLLQQLWFFKTCAGVAVCIFGAGLKLAVAGGTNISRIRGWWVGPKNQCSREWWGSGGEGVEKSVPLAQHPQSSLLNIN